MVWMCATVADGQVRTEKAWLIDFENAGNNQFWR